MTEVEKSAKIRLKSIQNGIATYQIDFVNLVLDEPARVRLDDELSAPESLALYTSVGRNWAVVDIRASVALRKALEFITGCLTAFDDTLTIRRG